MPILVEAEIWRDGGSLSAVIRNDDGSVSSYWLQTTHWNHPSEASHTNIFITVGSSPELCQHRVEVASDEEHAVLALFTSTNTTGCDPTGREHFARMVETLQNRRDQKNI